MIRFNLIWIGAVFLLLVFPIAGSAGISLGPKTNDNAAEAEQRRIALFYEAQKSNQEKLKAGQERFDQKQANRTKFLAAMTAELAARKETVTMGSAAVPYVEKNQTQNWAGTLLGVGIIGLSFLSFRYYLSRQEKKDLVIRKL